jgi:hypothetical protein
VVVGFVLEGNHRGVFSGNWHSISLDFDQFDDFAFVKSFKLSPGAHYAITVDAIGRNIETHPPAAVDANIGVHGTTFQSAGHDSGTGTFNRDLSVTFRVPLTVT